MICLAGQWHSRRGTCSCHYSPSGGQAKLLRKNPLAVFQSVHKPSLQTLNGLKDKLLMCRVYNSSWGRLCKARFLKAAHLGTPEEVQVCSHLSAPQKNTDNAAVQCLHSRLSCPHFPDSFATAFGDADFYLYGHKQDIMCVMVLLKQTCVLPLLHRLSDKHFGTKSKSKKPVINP